MREKKPVKCWMFTYPATTVVGVDDDERKAAEYADGLSPLVPAVAVSMADYREVRKTLQEAESWVNLAAHRGIGGMGPSEKDLRRLVVRLYAAAKLLPEVPHD